MSTKSWSRFFLVTLAGAGLAGCLPEAGGVGANAPVPGQSNSAPVISGTPGGSATVGALYVFQPTAQDADGDPLVFSATGLPAWASVNAQTGRVTGTPGASHVGSSGPIVVRVSDGEASASLPGFQITVTSSQNPPGNQPPLISGTPPTSIPVGSNFNFTPTASDPEGGPLAFSISLNGTAGSRPSWSTFNTTTGQLSGTAQAGTYNIVITVTDQAAASAFLAFTLTVAASPVGTAALSWSAPTQNTDGSALTDLAGYRVYHGTSPAALTNIVELEGSGNTSYTFNSLASGTHYFAVSAYNASRMESALSGVGSKIVP